MGNCCKRKGAKGGGRGSESDNAPGSSRGRPSRKHPMVKKVLDESDFAKVLQDSKLVVVDFYAPWCGPCQFFSPQLERFAEEFEENVTFVKVDIDDCEELALKYDVSSLPKFVFFRGGEKLDEYQGVKPDQLRKVLMRHIHIEPPSGSGTATVPKTAPAPETSTPKPHES